MKKIIALFCTLVLMFSFSACVIELPSGTNDEAKQEETERKKEDNDKSEKEEENETAPEEAPAETEAENETAPEEALVETEAVNETAPEEAPVETEAVNETAPEEAPAETEAVNSEVTFEEVVVVDNAECMITITGIEQDDFWGYTLKALCENKSAEKSYMFSVNRAAMNGVACNSFFAAEVAPGKKSNETITFSLEDLEENGVGDYTDIELFFRVHDSNDWFADAAAEETVHIYPYGEEKAVRFVREAQDTDTVILDNEYATVIVTGYENDDVFGYTVNLFLLNKTDKNVVFSMDEVSVNGFMADPYFASSVGAGKCAFREISWSDSTLEENGITEIEEIEFVLRVYDEDDWLADDFANEWITLNTGLPSGANDDAKQEQTDREDNDESSFEEVVVVDNAECMITITGIEQDDFWGYTLKALCENKSAEKSYMFSLDEAAMNGVSCDSFFTTVVAPGKKSNETITFSLEDLEENGVGDYTDIELFFRVYDSNDWSADDVAAETVHIYPYGEEKAVRFVREVQDTDTVILDNEYATVIVTGYEKDDIFGYMVNLFLLNKTDKNLMFGAEDASINGYMADLYYGLSVGAGKCAFSAIYLSDSTLEENGITEIEEIEFVLRVYDEDDWSADDFANEKITLNP